MAQLLINKVSMQHWLFSKLEEIFGFLTSTTTSYVIVNQIGATIINTLIVVSISGIVGGFIGWVFKAIASPYLDQKLKDWKKSKSTKIEKRNGKK